MSWPERDTAGEKYLHMATYYWSKNPACGTCGASSITRMWNIISLQSQGQRDRGMAMPLEMAIYLTKTVWFALSGWIFACLYIADEIAGSLRNRDIGHFHVG
ncbi:hypothetical protein Bca52824_050363 [Brassica carinata]|uniref:Uncharacterized protein n=1 Tax=Brassica carinata TaxID=52824 RepID=A0A8X7UTY9_BRACI|nr:hypothetical protein Bca52824_050363 [Brassica carinata]